MQKVTVTKRHHIGMIEFAFAVKGQVMTRLSSKQKTKQLHQDYEQ